ncbi:hypothetical protein CEB3_c09940 [Peptococcaceae bacterium CEB3]|nr:hypothetical protein CEB3_c09940 [Peptococcaceae bacterium CEB3]
MSKFTTNERCFVRNQECGRVFSGSKLCFIACPASEEISLELSVIKEKLRKYKIEPYVAVEERELGKDIFCEKICGKIIEAKFCVVILNHVKNENGTLVPNSNVYYEYGLMTGLHKKIIPIQKEGQKLAFNIQSFESIIYKPNTLTEEIDNAIMKTILNTEEREISDRKGMNPSWLAGLNGYIEIDRFGDRDFRDLVFQCKDTHMRAFQNPLEGTIAVIGPFEALSFPAIATEFKVIFNRLQQLRAGLQLQIQELEVQKEVDGLARARFRNGFVTLQHQVEMLEKVKYVLVDNPGISVDEVLLEIKNIPYLEVWTA